MSANAYPPRYHYLIMVIICNPRVVFKAFYLKSSIEKLIYSFAALISEKMVDMIAKDDIKAMPNSYSMVLNVKPSEELGFYSIIGSIDNPCLLVSLGRPASNIHSILKRHKIRHRSLHIIDAISMEINEQERTENSTYLPSSRNLSDIALEIEKKLSQFPPVKRTLIFDSISKLARFHTSDTLMGFLKFLDNRLKDLNTQVIFLADHQSAHLTSRMSFVDKISSL